MSTTPLLEIQGVSKRVREGDRERPIFENIALTVDRGERVALLGRSGSGKSTLLNLIAGIELPTDGTIRVDGRPINTIDERERTLFRRRHIGFVFQFFNLIPTLTVLENVALPLELNGEPRRDALSRARALLARVDLAEREAAFPDQLSGGEQQRVAITRALVCDPLLVLADEPTGNLDAATGRQVLELLDGLSVQQDVTLLTVTHSREVAVRADRALTLGPGGIEKGLGEDSW
ncbi:MAG: ABC transporter ATP-binding protein [Chromatiales bacterium]|jgi:putative ABC transport system ATP-binding protein